MAPNSSINQAVLPVVASEGSKKSLNVEVVTGVQQCAGPKASRFQPHPGEDKRDGDHHDCETGEAIPGGSAAVVIAPDQQGIVPADHTIPLIKAVAVKLVVLNSSGTRNPRQPISSPRAVDRLCTMPKIPPNNTYAAVEAAGEMRSPMRVASWSVNW